MNMGSANRHVSRANVWGAVQLPWLTTKEQTMAKVIAIMSMSLDGYVADTGDGVAEVFEWYTAGDVVVPNPRSDFTFHVSAPSAGHLRALMSEVGAMLTGRRTFDF